MEKELGAALDELRTALASDPRVRRLDELEKALLASPEIQELAKRKDAAEQAYEDVLVYHKESDPEALRLQQALYQAKKTLDEAPLAQSYNAAYIEVRDLYMALDDILFSPFRRKSLFEGSESC